MSDDKNNIEMYKIAFSRLTFQDEYLFKFSTVFLTVEGALVLAVRSALMESSGTNNVIIFVSCLGIFISVIWWLWLRQNDYWHSVWVGALKKIEKTISPQNQLFNLDDKELAKAGKRNKCLVFRGHNIASCLPIGLSVAWFILLVNTLCA